jgi:hypothetical protein
MPVNLASCILRDFFYQQDRNNDYIFQNDKFILVNRDEVADSILKNIDAIFEQYIGKDEAFSIERTYDPFALNQALCRYSRDIFGLSMCMKTYHCSNNFYTIFITESFHVRHWNFSWFIISIKRRSL